MREAVHLNDLGIVCALGVGKAEVAEALFAGDAPRGVAPSERYTPGRPLPIGAVGATLPDLAGLPVPLRGRNNGLLELALAQIRPAVDRALGRYGATRVGVVLGTSTSSIGGTEEVLRRNGGDAAWPEDFHYAQQEIGTAATFVAARTGARGPVYTQSTACSSAAKALASAARLLRAGVVDAVVAGGADALCGFTIGGFSALESISANRCNPFSARRDGINIGEGAALFLMTREPGPVRLAGWGETSDAHHMSAPEPEGRAPIEAVREALRRAGMGAERIDYVNLHGTATPQNDAMEAKVVAETLGLDVAASSTKPLTGHTLGAAGAIEAGLCWLAMRDNPQGRLPPHWWDGQVDPALPPLHLVRPGERLGRPLRHVLSHSFAFGGSNAVLLFSAE